MEMIFHPLVWRGIPLRVIDGEPLGLIGWQGIVPAKAGVMAERMVDMVTTQLVDVEEVRKKLYFVCVCVFFVEIVCDDNFFLLCFCFS